MRTLLLLPFLLAACADQPKIAPVSTPQDWDRWLMIGPNCGPYSRHFCLADSATGSSRHAELLLAGSAMPQ